MKDAATKGRLPVIGSKNTEETKNKFKLLCGDNANKVKLKEKEVLEIKEMLMKKYKIKEIYKKFNVSRTCISDIKHGKNWKHLT